MIPRRSLFPLPALLIALLPACSALDSLKQKIGMSPEPESAAAPQVEAKKHPPLSAEKVEEILHKQQAITRRIRDQFLRDRLGKAQEDDLHFVPYAGEEWAQVSRKEKQ